MATVQSGMLSMVYGPSGVGKTTACLAAFPNAVCVAQPRAVRVASSVLGFQIPSENVRPALLFGDVIRTVGEEIEKGHDVVVDDLTPIAEYTVDEYRKKKTGYDVMHAVSSDVLRLRRLVEPTSRAVAMNAHLGQPHVNQLNHRPIRGGPKLPGQLPELIVTAFDHIFRFDVDPARSIGFPKSISCFPDSTDYIYKDRDNIVIGAVPANLREVLIAAGYKLGRPAGLEWMDQSVESVATFWTANLPLEKAADKSIVGPLNAQLRAALQAQRTTVLQHQNWVLQDGFDRYLIRQHRAMRQAGPLSFLGG